MASRLEVGPTFKAYAELVDELRGRTLKPLSHPSFVIYFIVAVIGFGGLGFWIELYAYLVTSPADLNALRTAILTFFPALAGATSLQVIWSEDRKPLRSFAVLTMSLFLTVALIIGPKTGMSNGPALLLGILASLSASWVWWVTNANQKDFLDVIEPDDSVGGNLKEKLAGEVDLQDFKH